MALISNTVFDIEEVTSEGSANVNHLSMSYYSLDIGIFMYDNAGVPEIGSIFGRS
jgi:hypothetical protein